MSWFSIYTTTAVLYFLQISFFTFPSLFTWLISLNTTVSWFNTRRLAFAIVFAMWLEAIFWVAQLLNYLITKNRSLFKQFTIPKTHVKYPSPTLINTALSDTISGHLLRPFLLWLVYPVYQWRGCFSAATPAPTVVVAQLMFCILVDDGLFYWSHRLLHENRWLYHTIHKQHHQFRYSVGLAVEYAHPVEDLLSNTIPTVLGALLLGSHVSVAFGYMAMKVWQSIDAHCGFLLPFPLSPWNVLPGMDCALAHDFHHSHNMGCYGGFFVWWDVLCGTDKAYRKSLGKRKTTAHEISGAMKEQH